MSGREARTWSAHWVGAACLALVVVSSGAVITLVQLEIDPNARPLPNLLASLTLAVLAGVGYAVPRVARSRPVGDLRRSITMFRRYAGGRRVYVAGVVLLVIEAATAAIEPYPISYLIDYLQGERPDIRAEGGPVLLASERYETILVLTAAIVLIAAVNSAADSLTEVCMARGGRSLGYRIRVSMYSHLQRLPLAYHDKRRTGDVLTRVTGDVLVVEDFVVKSVSNILGSVLVLVASFGLMLYQSWRVALVALLIVPLLSVLSNHFSRRIKTASKMQRDREGDLASTAQEMLSSIRLVQSYGRGSVDLEQFSDQTARSMQASLGAANIQAQFSFVIALTEALAISAVIWLGVVLFDKGAITIGTLVLFVLLLQNMFKPARKIVSEWYKIGKVFASVERIQDLMDREVVVQDEPDAIPAPPFAGRLAFRHVSFAYPVDHGESPAAAAARRLVLDDISFEVAPGEVVSLVGESGAGKSTIAQLVPRLYDPDEGEVLIDDLPVRRLTLASLREQVSLVLQDTLLLSGTVAENIAYGIADASREDVEAAARAANAHDFIVGLPDGYDSVLGERGATLSGGQRQRIAIARAFIRRAPILVLDEPTTGLDRESSQSVIDALRTLMRGTTTVVISHDPGLIRCADRVLVVSVGHIVEQGTYEELSRSEGRYAELFGSGPSEPLADDPSPSSAAVPPVPRVPPLQPPPVRTLPGTRRLPATLGALEARLPGITRAVDPVVAAEQVRRMLSADVTVEDVSVGGLWLRTDGTCDVRYQLRLRDGASERHEEIVLGRVHGDLAGATAYVARFQGRYGVHSAGPHWNRTTAVGEELAIGLSRLPLHPELPALPLVMDGTFVQELDPFAASDEPPAVTLVHHPREGACVVRYDVGRPHGRVSDEVRMAYYGKVYGDGSGEVVDGFLRALSAERPSQPGRCSTRFPQPVLYEPGLRLVLTKALPGATRVPVLLKDGFSQAPGPAAQQLAQLRSAVLQSARALAELHEDDRVTAPVRTVEIELRELDAEFDVVDRVWPEEAERIRAAMGPTHEMVHGAPDLVLSHGDFTPSQVLLDGPSVAVVDLDTLCWAEPALDLGRYLAHLELLGTRAGGAAARGVVQDLAEEFLRGYAGTSARNAAAVEAADRIRCYEATTLARSALRACRQLKPDRYERALSLLECTWTGRVDR